MWKSNNSLLNNKQEEEEITTEIRNEYFAMNEYNYATYQKLGDSTKTVLRGKFIAVNTYVRKKERRFQINNLIFHLKKLEIKKQTKLKASRRKKIIKIRAEINEIENRKTTEKNQQNQKLVL